MRTGRKRSDFICLGLILLLAAVFFFPVWGEGKTFLAFDTLKGYYPWAQQNSRHSSNNGLLTDPVNAPYPASLFLGNTYFRQSWERYGEFPWWQTTLLNGIPFTGYYTALPKVLFWMIFSPVGGHDLFLFIHLAAAGVFMFLLLRQSRCLALPALLGAWSWMFNGYVMAWFEFDAFLLLAATLPAGFYFIDRWWRYRGPDSWLGLAVTVGWAAGAGYAHLLMLQMVFYAVYVLFRIRREKFRLPSWRRALSLLAAVALGGLLSLNFFLSHYEMKERSARKSYSWSGLTAKTGELPVKYLVTLLYPDFFGGPHLNLDITPKKSAEQSYNNYSELCIHAGALTLMLALLALAGRPRSFRLRFFAVAGILILLMAMGNIVYYPLYRLLPGLTWTTPTRILQLFGFCLCVGAAFGAQTLLRRRYSLLFRRSATAIAAVIFGFAAAIPLLGRCCSSFVTGEESILPQLAFFFSRYYSWTSPPVLIPGLAAASAAIGLVLILLLRHRRFKAIGLAVLMTISTVALMWHGWKYNTAVPRRDAFPETAGIAFLRNQAMPFRIMTFGRFYLNGFAPFGIDNIGGYNSSVPSRFQQYVFRSQGYDAFPDYMNRMLFFRNSDSPLIDALNVKYFVTPPGNGYRPGERMTAVYRGEINIFANRLAFERACFVPAAVAAADGNEAFLRTVCMTRRDFRSTVVLENIPSLPPPGTTGQVTGIFHSPNRIVVDARTAAGGWLLLSDLWNADWRATVNGKAAPIYRADYIMRAVKLPAGISRIEFCYRPLAAWVGWYVSSCLWGLAALLLPFFVWRNRCRRAVTTGND